MHHVIYVPGLGDDRTYGQDVALNLWRLFGLTPHFLPLGWANAQPFQNKLDKLLQAINGLKTDDNYVSLVGVSAGASATLNAYALTDKVSGVVWICGKINNPQTIGRRIFERNPAFEESLALVTPSLRKLDLQKRHRIMSIHPLEDRSVAPDDTKVAGALEKVIRSKGHAQSIAYSVLFCGRTIGRFLRAQQA